MLFSVKNCSKVIICIFMVEAWGVEPQCSMASAKLSTCLDTFAISLAKGLHGVSTCVLKPTYFSEESEATPMICLRACIVQLHPLLFPRNFNRIHFCFAYAKRASSTSAVTNSSALLKMYSACAKRALTSVSSAFVFFDLLL